MRILHISRTMGQGGAEKIVFQLCRDNYEQCQFVVSSGGSYVDELEKIGIKHYKIPDIASRNPIKMIFCFWKILKIVKKNRIQIIHTHHRMAAFYACLVSFFTNVGCVYTAHNVFIDKKMLLRFSLRKAIIVAVGDGVRKNLVDVYGFDVNKIVTVYNSINTKIANQKNVDLIKAKQNGKYLVGIIGRITRQKGINIFLRALAEFSKKNKNVLGVIVGDGEDLESMKKLASKLGIDEKVMFLGYQHNVLDIMRQLDLIVSASRWEGLPLTPIEAFSQRKTIIATDIIGNNEIVKDQFNGLLFKKDSVNGLINSLQKISSDKRLKNRLEVNAYKTFQDKYRYDLFIDGYNNVYNSLFESK
ncbi:glycosyltransferase family 4 protein [Pediococcus inopinatus]|uniref:glycosyltransferase family 4 protein n=1 Tax=Pediococcus inopinatus TaxID=114090 RepID=UPI002B26153A|nr:glycosyltransferase family 4 protein [Pediococcus inopinatus]WPC17396.1 glycosyltransferase family 4 protein [Pediococcus inopinatus]